MEATGAAFGCDVNLRNAFKLGRVGVVLQLKLFHGIERRGDRRGAEGRIGIGLAINLERRGRRS